MPIIFLDAESGRWFHPTGDVSAVPFCADWPLEQPFVNFPLVVSRTVKPSHEGAAPCCAKSSPSPKT
jgi:hypothetical protein